MIRSLAENRKGVSFEAPAEACDVDYFDLGEVTSPGSSHRRTALLERIGEQALSLMRLPLSKEVMQIASERLFNIEQFAVGPFGNSRIEGRYLGANQEIALVHQWRDPVHSDDHPLEYISIQIPNESTEPVMRGIKIRVVCEYWYSEGVSDKDYAFGLITDRARDDMIAICRRSETAWQDWLTSNFILPGYSDAGLSVGLSLVRLRDFSEPELNEFAAVLDSALIGQPIYLG